MTLKDDAAALPEVRRRGFRSGGSAAMAGAVRGVSDEQLAS